MQESTFQQRTTELAVIWQDNRWLYILVGVIVGMLAAPTLEQLYAAPWPFITAYAPHALLAIAIVAVLEGFNRRRYRQSETARIIREMGSDNRVITRRATSEARKMGIHTDGSLRGAWLRDANLERSRLNGANLHMVRLNRANLKQARLGDANLEKANMVGADLTRAWLRRTNLHNAMLDHANLKRATLDDANAHRSNWWMVDLSDARLSNSIFTECFMEESDLQNADLTNADFSRSGMYCAKLQGATLNGTCFQGTDLHAADLRGVTLADVDLRGAELTICSMEGATLENVLFDENTVLPDARILPQDVIRATGKRFDRYWTPDTDMTRYTDPEHSQFWQPPWCAEGYDSQWHYVRALDPGAHGEAGYDDRSEWNVDGRPSPEQAAQQGRTITPWAAAGFSDGFTWKRQGSPQPWVKAGYMDHTAWVRDGRPSPA